MVDRITIAVPTYMFLDNQWQIVYPGSVIDVPTAANFSSSTHVPTRETAGSLASHGGPTPVRNVRRGF